MYKGIVFNIIYNLLFVIVGYGIHFVLGYSMTPAQYGIMGSILTILDFEYLFLNNGVRQSLSKEISSQRYNILDIILKGLIFQFILIALIFFINYFGAGLFAGILNDDNISRYIKIAAFLIPFNGLYVITVGINEGIHKFVCSAAIGYVYSIFKLSVIPFVLFIFEDPIFGAEMGYLAGIIAALAMGIIMLVINKKHLHSNIEKSIPFGYYVKNTLNFSLFFIIVSVVLSVDTLIVKAVIKQGEMAGFYTGAVNFAKVAYFVLSAFFTIMLPAITEKYTKGKFEEASKTIKNILIIILAFVMPLAVIISSSSENLLIAFYNEKYIAAADTLMLLVWAHFFMGLTVMFNMIIAAANEKKFSSILAIVVVSLDIFSGVILTKGFGITGMALAVVLSTVSALAASMQYARKFYKNIYDIAQAKILGINILLWIILKLVFTHIYVKNIFMIGILYIIVYIVYILLLQVLRIINIKKMLTDILKK